MTERPLDQARRSPRRTCWIVVSVACVGGLVACTGSDPAPAPTAQVPSSSVSASAARVEQADKDLHDVTCKHSDDGWSFTGEVKNSGKQQANYTVTVRIAPRKNTKQTVGLTTITKTVEPGKTVPFAAKNFSTLAAKGNVCRTLTTKA